MDPDLLAQLVDWVKSKKFGKYRGQVVSNEDKTTRGRLKVKVPEVLGTLEVWAMPCVPYAGPQVAFFAMPPKDAGVWIEFEGGDPSFPIWTGCFWADNQMPLGGKPGKKVWKTKSITIVLDDDGDKVTVENTAKSLFELAQAITSTVKKSKHEVAATGITSDSGGKGKVEVTSASVAVNTNGFQVS